jgi:DNA uptake protein ComE-like DNA-binding protein
LEELDSLPGVGKVTAQKIIDNRPFKALEELINQKIITKSVFEKIKNLIEI